MDSATQRPTGPATPPGRAAVLDSDHLETLLGLAEDDAIRETLQVLAEDIVTHSGFGAAVFGVRDSESHLRVVVCAGEGRIRPVPLGSAVSLSTLDDVLRHAQPWQNLRFVADVRTAGRRDLSGVWLGDADGGRPDGGQTGPAQPQDWWSTPLWRAENALLAPLRRADGEVLGLLSVGAPQGGRQPSEAQRMTLSIYAKQAERNIAAAARRTSVVRQLKLAEAARLIVREAGTQTTVSDLLPRARAALLSNFALREAWIKSTPGDDDGPGHPPLMAPAAGSPDALPPSLLPALTRTAEHCWAGQQVVEVSSDSTDVPGLSPGHVGELLDLLTRHDVTSALIVPLGSGTSRLGSMLLGRSATGRAWSEAEKSVALDIGHDIGRAMVHTLWFEAQQRANDEIRAHAEYKRDLMMTMSHELQTPLASIRGHVELIAPDVAEDDTLRRALLAIERGSDRLTKLVNNMLWLAKVDDPRRPTGDRVVDVVEAVRTVVEDATRFQDVGLVDASALTEAGEGRRLALVAPGEPVWVDGVENELVLMCCNLVANALKYTDEDGRVRVAVGRDGDRAELLVIDDGIGIAAEEVDLVFDDFYRSPAPAVRRRAGTGLGLGIVRRIAARHGGGVEVDAGTPGRTCFRVVLPLSTGTGVDTDDEAGVDTGVDSGGQADRRRSPGRRATDVAPQR